MYLVGKNATVSHSQKLSFREPHGRAFVLLVSEVLLQAILLRTDTFVSII